MTGTVYWITGLSGAGKTTIGSLLVEDLKRAKNNIVYLDGDVLREVFGAKGGYRNEDRKELAMRYSHLCKLLSEQGIDVVCATISMFRDVVKKNREEIKNYIEIYIKVPIDILIKRDQKQLYSRALNNEIKDVMGVDIGFEEPECPDIVVINDGSKTPQQVFEGLKANLCEVK
jgi:cytidine diphosphoramidate kinase